MKQFPCLDGCTCACTYLKEEEADRLIPTPSSHHQGSESLGSSLVGIHLPVKQEVDHCIMSNVWGIHQGSPATYRVRRKRKRRRDALLHMWTYMYKYTCMISIWNNAVLFISCLVIINKYVYIIKIYLHNNNYYFLKSTQPPDTCWILYMHIPLLRWLRSAPLFTASCTHS